MKYVLDASVAVKWVLPEPDSEKALALQDDHQKQIHELLSPDIFPVEVAHALTRAERRNLIPQGDSVHKLADVLAIGPALHSYLPLLARATEVSSQIRIGVYDCLYIALAEQEGCPVVSADDRLLKSAKGYPIIALSSLP